MKARNRTTELIAMLTCLGALVVVVASGIAQPEHRLQIPEDHPGPPFYAGIDRTFLPTDGQWAVISFIRSPQCIPADFNLLDGIDRPPRPYLCPLTITGHLILRAGFPPTQALYQGTGAVPHWFVSWPELQAAIADDVLTIAELAALPSLQTGFASFFVVSVHNTDPAQRPGHSETNAFGVLTNGQTFRVHINEKLVDGVRILLNVDINFK